MWLATLTAFAPVTVRAFAAASAEIRRVLGAVVQSPGAVSFYLYITGNMVLSGSFWIVVGGLYWKRANVVGAYSALIRGAAIPLFYFAVPHPDAWAGRWAFSPSWQGSSEWLPARCLAPTAANSDIESPGRSLRRCLPSLHAS